MVKSSISEHRSYCLYRNLREMVDSKTLCSTALRAVSQTALLLYLYHEQKEEIIYINGKNYL